MSLRPLLGMSRKAPFPIGRLGPACSHAARPTLFAPSRHPFRVWRLGDSSPAPAPWSSAAAHQPKPAGGPHMTNGRTNTTAALFSTNTHAPTALRSSPSATDRSSVLVEFTSLLPPPTPAFTVDAADGEGAHVCTSERCRSVSRLLPCSWKSEWHAPEMVGGCAGSTHSITSRPFLSCTTDSRVTTAPAAMSSGRPDSTAAAHASENTMSADADQTRVCSGSGSGSAAATTTAAMLAAAVLRASACLWGGWGRRDVSAGRPRMAAVGGVAALTQRERKQC
jgi:hypothetical protein